MTGSAARPPRSVVVAGGSGAVGTMFARLWSQAGARVVRADIGSGSDLDIRRPGEELESSIRSADVLVLAVPEGAALAAVPVVAPLLRPDAVLVETLSVKTPFAAALNGGGPEQVLGVNPMFAPALGLPGRPVAAVIHRPGPGVDAVLAELRAWGARVAVTTTERHDRVCAAMQALTHAAVLSFGLALADLGVDTDDTAETAPPPFVVASALLARITGGTPEVYRDVQTANPFAPAARAALARAVSRVSDAAVSGPDAFADLLAEAGAPLGARADAFADLCAGLFAGLDR